VIIDCLNFRTKRDCQCVPQVHPFQFPSRLQNYQPSIAMNKIVLVVLLSALGFHGAPTKRAITQLPFFYPESIAAVPLVQPSGFDVTDDLSLALLTLQENVGASPEGIHFLKQTLF
jgi:hypothetical protein